MTSHLEVERTFAPPTAVDLPDLREISAVARIESSGETDLDATYYDTPDLVLLRAGVTFRRRVGGADEGWHVKLPTGQPGARQELHHPLGELPEPPPAALVDLVEGWLGGIALAPVARIRTHRSTTRLVAADGTVLAELAEDDVDGLAAQLGAEPHRWREWEVELVDAPPRLLDEIEGFFADHGVPVGAVQRKVARVVDRASDSATTGDEPSENGPARVLLQARISEQVRQIELLDPVVRLDGEGGVHGLRKACRRLRSALATYRPLVDRSVTDPIRRELQWLGRELAGARDADVVDRRIIRLVDEQEDRYVVGPVRERITQRRRTDAGAAHDAVIAVFGSDRYRSLRSALARLAQAPPWTDQADLPVREVVPRRLNHEWRRIRRIHRDTSEPHELRKAARRFRYAYEVAAPVWSRKAKPPRRAAKRLTDVLGERQDAVVARDGLVDLARDATAAGESAFTYGRLHALEELAEPALLEEAERRWGELRRVRW